MLTVSSPAATYAFSNGASLNASGIAEMTIGNTFSATFAAGTAFPSGGGISAGPGVYGVGIFSTDNLVGLNAAALIASYTSLTGGTSAFASFGPFGSRGVFSLNALNITITGSVFENRNMYLFVGNGLTFSSSSMLMVVKSQTLFLASDDNNPTPVSETFRPDNTTILVGGYVAPNVQTTSADTTINPGWVMVAPEGSTAFLGTIGMLTLLRRRRVS